LVTPGGWSLGRGQGKWEFILRDAVKGMAQGARILDLGCNNGFHSMQLLRHGATRAVGIDFNARAVGQAVFLKEVFEWLDMRPYDFQAIEGDMLHICRSDIGPFDIAMAINSLYYLEDEDIDKVIRRVAETAAVFLVQCSLTPRPREPEVERRASVEYMSDKLRHGGFEVTNVIAPRWYPRPLIVATSLVAGPGTALGCDSAREGRPAIV